jgi:hypothetical protein
MTAGTCTPGGGRSAETPPGVAEVADGNSLFLNPSPPLLADCPESGLDFAEVWCILIVSRQRLPGYGTIPAMFASYSHSWTMPENACQLRARHAQVAVFRGTPVKGIDCRGEP